MPHTYSLAIRSNYCSIHKVLNVFIEDIRTKICLLLCSDIRQPNNTGVRLSFQNSEFTKIFVQCYENPLLAVCNRENL